MTTLVSPGNIGLPPPTARPLIDMDRGVGWVTGNTVGFLGFANEAEAADAAWVAYRTLTQPTPRFRSMRGRAVGGGNPMLPGDTSVVMAVLRFE